MARLREGRANTARGAAHFLRETAGRVRHAGATGQLTVRADSGFYAIAWYRSAAAERALLHHHPPARPPAEPDRGHTRDGLGGPSHTGWTAQPTWPRPSTPPSRVSPTPPRCGSSSAGEAHARFPTGPLRQLQLSRLHHQPRRRYPGTGGRPPPPCRSRERHKRPQVRRRTQPSPLGALRRQRCLAGDTEPAPCSIRGGGP